MTPSLVHSVNSTSATRVGCTKTDPRGGFGPSPAANGESSRRSSTFARRSSSASVKPVPTRPAKRSAAVLLDADEQRADAIRALAGARHPAADDDVLAAHVLDLQPALRAAAGLVRAVEPLRDDALEAVLEARREHGRAVADDVIGRAPRRALEPEVREQLAALGVGQLEQRMPVEPQQVEDEVRDRHLLGEAAHRGLAAHVHPRLQASEARAGRVRFRFLERDDLAVEDRAVRAQRPVQRAKLGIAAGDVVAVAALEADPAGLGVRQRAHAVPLDLERPVRIVARQRCRAGQHRLELRGHRLARRIRRRIHAVDHPVLAGRLPLDASSAGTARSARSGARRGR